MLTIRHAAKMTSFSSGQGSKCSPKSTWRQGLHIMKEYHFHLAPGEPQSDGVISDPVIKVIDNVEKLNGTVDLFKKGYNEDLLYSVCCVPGNPSEEGKKYGIICISDVDDNVYIFDMTQEELMMSSPLFDFLQISKSTKVFYGCPDIGKVFFDAYKVLMPYMTVLDIQMAYCCWKEIKESPSLENICQELEVDTKSSDQSPESMETVDWSVRPITDPMIGILKNTAWMQMAAFQKLQEKLQSEANKKELRWLTYKSIAESLGSEKMEKVKKLHEDRKKLKKPKKEPVAKSHQKTKKKQHELFETDDTAQILDISSQGSMNLDPQPSTSSETDLIKVTYPEIIQSQPEPSLTPSQLTNTHTPINLSSSRVTLSKKQIKHKISDILEIQYKVLKAQKQKIKLEKRKLKLEINLILKKSQELGIPVPDDSYSSDSD